MSIIIEQGPPGSSWVIIRDTVEWLSQTSWNTLEKVYIEDFILIRTNYGVIHCKRVSYSGILR